MSPSPAPSAFKFVLGGSRSSKRLKLWELALRWRKSGTLRSLDASADGAVEPAGRITTRMRGRNRMVKQELEVEHGALIEPLVGVRCAPRPGVCAADVKTCAPIPSETFSSTPSRSGGSYHQHGDSCHSCAAILRTGRESSRFGGWTHEE